MSHSRTGGTRWRAGATVRAAADAGTAAGDELSHLEGDDADEMDEEALDSHASYAFLHDFCMCIPYGMILALAGIVSLCCRGFSTGLALLGAGVVTEMLASLSLKNWKLRRDSRLFTSSTAGIALAITVSMWQRATSGLAAFAARSLSGVSALMLLFLVYNVAAGGNPPKKGGAEGTAAEAESAAAAEAAPLVPQG